MLNLKTARKKKQKPLSQDFVNPEKNRENDIFIGKICLNQQHLI